MPTKSTPIRVRPSRAETVEFYLRPAATSRMFVERQSDGFSLAAHARSPVHFIWVESIAGITLSVTYMGNL